MRTLKEANAAYEEQNIEPWTFDHHQSEINKYLTEARLGAFKEQGIDLEKLKRENAYANRMFLDEWRANRDPKIKYPNAMQQQLGSGQSASTLAAMARHKAEDEAAKAGV